MMNFVFNMMILMQTDRWTIKRWTLLSTVLSDRSFSLGSFV